MTAKHVFSVIRAHSRLVWGIALLGLVAGGGLGVIKSLSHSATALVIATAHSPQASDPVTASVDVEPLLAPDYIATQVDIIHSERVAQRAAELLKMDTDPEALQEYRESGSDEPPLTYFARGLLRHLKIIPSVGSRVVALEYTSPRSGQAAAVANAFARAYQDVSLEMAVSPSRQSDEWYQHNLDDLRKQLNDAQTKLVARQRELGVTAPLGTSSTAINSVEADDARLAALSQNLAAAQAAQTTASSRTGGGALPDTLLNPVIQGLDIDIKRLEGQRVQMATHFGPNSQQMREIDGQIQGLQREHDRQVALVTKSVGAAAGQSSANVHGLEAQLNAEKGRVIQSHAARGELGSLQQDVDALRRAYDDLIARRANAKLIGSGEQTNVSILSPATPEPSRAVLIIVIATVAGALIGLVLGAFAAVVAEYADERIRAPGDIEDMLGIPNLGTVNLRPSTPPRSLFGPALRLFPARG
jgi:uncharacterized protein involved in exopolysaccharide biosynthesis